MTDDLSARLTAVEARLRVLEGAAAKRVAASARANSVRAERALTRARKVEGYGSAIGWQDAARKITDGGIVELIRGLLQGEGIRASCSSIRRDLLRELGRPRVQHWSDRQRSEAAVARRGLRLAAK